MQIITGSFNASPARPKAKRRMGYFLRPELQRILNVYARKVAAGEWRDYSIDHLEGRAFFSIYRSSHENPLYTIEKRLLKGNNGWLFCLHDRRKVVKSGQLQDVLEALSKKPKLVNN